jgi:hypothetical protein
MQEKLKPILDIQELDMKMLRLMRVKRERQKEVKQIEDLRKDLHLQMQEKEEDIKTISENIHSHEKKIEEIAEKVKKLEAHQATIKKVEDFNALTQEMTGTERERINMEQKIATLIEHRTTEQELLEKISESLATSEESSIALEKEIQSGIALINTEGSALKAERDKLAATADEDTLRIYERLLRNKKDRVVVPIQNRTCNGCHITLTPQHENLVRKGDNLVYCEHCSRIHYWQESEAVEGTAVATKRRRRRLANA